MQKSKSRQRFITILVDQLGPVMELQCFCMGKPRWPLIRVIRVIRTQRPLEESTGEKGGVYVYKVTTDQYDEPILF